LILTGVTVLLFPPEVDDVNNTLPGVEELPPNVTPADAMSSTNPNKIGKTGRHDIPVAEILLKVALKHQKSKSTKHYYF
jgi:hypothetical protein